MKPSLTRIQSRCTMSGQHWLWRGAVSGDAVPFMWHQGRVVPVRRLVLEARDGQAPAPDTKAIADCEHTNCVSPHCTKGVTHAENCVRAASRRPDTLTALRSQRVAIARRSSSRISDAAVRRMRESTEPATVVAAREGVSGSFVLLVRKGLRRRELQPIMWAGLGARA